MTEPDGMATIRRITQWNGQILLAVAGGWCIIEPFEQAGGGRWGWATQNFEYFCFRINP